LSELSAFAESTQYIPHLRPQAAICRSHADRKQQPPMTAPIWIAFPPEVHSAGDRTRGSGRRLSGVGQCGCSGPVPAVAAPIPVAATPIPVTDLPNVPAVGVAATVSYAPLPASAPVSAPAVGPPPPPGAQPPPPVVSAAGSVGTQSLVYPYLVGDLGAGSESSIRGRAHKPASDATAAPGGRGGIDGAAGAGAAASASGTQPHRPWLPLRIPGTGFGPGLRNRRLVGW
jgi:hypothetical protein